VQRVYDVVCFVRWPLTAPFAAHETNQEVTVSPSVLRRLREAFRPYGDVIFITGTQRLDLVCHSLCLPHASAPLTSRACRWRCIAPLNQQAFLVSRRIGPRPALTSKPIRTRYSYVASAAVVPRPPSPCSIAIVTHRNK
jgi:hypothetical protein